MYNYWKLLIKKEVVFGREYVKCMEDELTMAVVFGYKVPLELKLIEFSGEVKGLVEMPWEVEIEWNGNLRVFNL